MWWWLSTTLLSQSVGVKWTGLVPLQLQENPSVVFQSLEGSPHSWPLLSSSQLAGQRLPTSPSH